MVGCSPGSSDSATLSDSATGGVEWDPVETLIPPSRAAAIAWAVANGADEAKLRKRVLSVRSLRGVGFVARRSVPRERRPWHRQEDQTA